MDVGQSLLNLLSKICQFDLLYSVLSGLQAAEEEDEDVKEEGGEEEEQRVNVRDEERRGRFLKLMKDVDEEEDKTNSWFLLQKLFSRSTLRY